jgi:FkbM family methyltransferase
MIRYLGDKGYGGYNTETKTLNADSVVYSFGIGENISWDLAMIELGCVVHAFDPTPRSIEFVNNQVLPPQFIFHPYGVAHFDGVAKFNPQGSKPQNVSVSMQLYQEWSDQAIELPVKRLSTIMKELGHNHIDVLKMDIEGEELFLWSDLKNIRIGQMLLDFDGKRKMDKIRQWLLTNKMRLRGYSTVKNGQDISFVK